MQEELKSAAPRLILSVTDTKAEKTLYTLLEEAHIPLRFQFHGQGTANSEILRICGLGESDRILTMWILPKSAVPVLFHKMNESLHLKRRGKGIAVSIPLTGIQMNLAKLMNAQHPQQPHNTTEQEGCKMAEGSGFSMIIVTVNQGFSDDVIDTAKEAGAKGGTIIRGRRRGLDSAMKFWGISLQEEQEIVLIIVPKSIKKEVMGTISKTHGLCSPAHGLVLSIPIEDALGLET